MKKFITMTLLCALVAITRNPLHIEADIYSKPLTVQETIVKYAVVYGVPEKELLSVAQCESSFNPIAIGDKGLARGIFQYHKPTFIRFAALMGEDLDYNSFQDQAKLTSWIFANHPEFKKHWTCFSTLFNP